MPTTELGGSAVKSQVGISNRQHIWMGVEMGETVATTVDEAEAKPGRLAWFFSLVLGIGLAMVGTAHFYQGNYEQASLDFAGAFGTVGLPALKKRGYHIEIRRDAKAFPVERVSRSQEGLRP